LLLPLLRHSWLAYSLFRHYAIHTIFSSYAISPHTLASIARLSPPYAASCRHAITPLFRHHATYWRRHTATGRCHAPLPFRLRRYTYALLRHWCRPDFSAHYCHWLHSFITPLRHYAIPVTCWCRYWWLMLPIRLRWYWLADFRRRYTLFITAITATRHHYAMAVLRRRLLLMLLARCYALPPPLLLIWAARLASSGWPRHFQLTPAPFSSQIRCWLSPLPDVITFDTLDGHWAIDVIDNSWPLMLLSPPSPPSL